MGKKTCEKRKETIARAAVADPPILTRLAQGCWREGRIVGRFEREELTAERLVRAAAGIGAVPGEGA